MGDRARLFLTGIAAAGAVAVAFAAPAPWSIFHFNRDQGGATIPLSQLRNFDGITLESSDDVVVTPGDHYAVALEGRRDAAKYMNLYVRDGVLHVARRSHGGWFGSGNAGVTVRVTMPGLTRLWLGGSGDIKVERFAGKELRALVAGSGDLVVDNVQADAVLATIRGSGDMEIAGKAKTVTAEIQGSGDMKLDDLDAEKAVVTIRGSGSVEAHASQSARLDVTGSGEAHVSGTNQCQISMTGSGGADCKS